MKLIDLLSSSDSLVASIATKAVLYSAQLKAGELQRAEYDDLCAQLLDFKRIAADAGVADLKTEVVQAIEFLANFVKI